MFYRTEKYSSVFCRVYKTGKCSSAFCIFYRTEKYSSALCIFYRTEECSFCTEKIISRNRRDEKPCKISQGNLQNPL